MTSRSLSSNANIAFLTRLLCGAMGVGSVAALGLSASACGGKVVVDGLDGSGGSGAGGSGAGGLDTGTSTSTGTATFTCDIAIIPEHQLDYACGVTKVGGACPAADDPAVFKELSAQLNGYFECNEVCGCDRVVVAVPCGPDPTKPNDCCYYAESSVQSGFCEGRPFTVHGEARAASLEARADWRADLRPDLRGLDEATRRALADAWARDARYEHASVASFARFTLELLALGAPAELVRGAQQAAGDEVRHAELCFGLASHFAGAPIGPGPLAMDDALLGRGDLAGAAIAAVREGCVNETLAALVALAQRDAATDPAVRAALELIAADEAAHAALAWRFVTWVWERGDAQLRDAIARAFAEAAPPVEPEADVAGVDPSLLRAYGRLPAAELHAIAERGFFEVVRPCAAALAAGKSAVTAAGIVADSAVS